MALGQYDIGWHDAPGSLARAAAVVEQAVDAGARLVVLPEMCTTGFTMDTEHYAETLSGPSVHALARLAAQHHAYLLAGVPTRADGQSASCHNSALLFGPDGELQSHYLKQRLYALGGEAGAYVPGATPLIAEIDGVRIAPFICYDLRFPELFRTVSSYVDALIVIASWPVARRQHWDVLLRARSIENQCYLVAVNRIGEGGGLLHDGGSVAYDPWGDLLCAAGAGDATEKAFTVEIDPAVVARIRSEYPFVKDCRAAAFRSR